MFCHNCGNQLPEGAKFCHECGAKVVFEETVQQPADEPVVDDVAVDEKGCSHQSRVINNQSFQTADDAKSPKKPYGESIKPYYREQFDRIASGQKPKFNWAALFFNGWVQLYNGCNRIFYKTFLPVYIALFMGSLIGLIGIFSFNIAVMVIAAVIEVATSLASTVLSIVNGFRFNEWYYQDVINNPGKKRSRKGFWTLLICGIAVIGISPVLIYIRLMSFYDDYSDVLLDDGLYEGLYDYGADDAIAGEPSEAGDAAVVEEAPEAETIAIDEASAEAALRILFDWLQRHPLMQDIKIEFMEQAVDAGDGTSYLLYVMYMEQEEYGIFGVNPDTADIIMDSLLDSQGNLETIQVPMDQWYLEYYWGWTDDSGYYSEPYTEDIYEVYNGESALILEYYPSNDSYAICDYDGQSFIEYDDGTAASEVSISDFAGSYWCDQSGEVEGTFVENGYALEIGEVNNHCFSIAETWRGIDVLQDEWARPRMLVRDTLVFEIYSSGVGYETHSLTYVPSRYSQFGQDVVYLDDDDTMPFVRQ